MKIEYFSHRGAVRDKNEDTIIGLTYLVGYTPYHVFVVCDGVGGGADGKFASSTVCEQIKEGLESLTKQGYRSEDVNLEVVQLTVSRSVQKANELIYQKYGRLGKLSGTTCTVLITNGKEFNYLHVGDSRLYELGELELIQLTVDDTYVQAEVSAGRMTEAQALTHPKRHVITKAVGATLNVLMYHSDIYEATRPLILTSDGYSELLTFKNVKELVASSSSASLIAEGMMDRGQKDNLSLVLIDFGG